MATNDFQGFGEAFHRFLKEESLEQTYLEKKLVSEWAAIMGQAIASRTINHYIKNKILHVQLSSAPLKQELNLLKEQVKEKINQYLGKEVVQEVRFK